jgi:hypothetical protein
MTAQINASTDVEQFLGTVVTDVAAAFHAASVALGDKLGLRAALARGPASAVRDGDGRFALSFAQAAVLADPDAPTYLAGAAVLAGVLFKDDTLAAEAFRTGRGVGWHEHHADLFVGTERLFRPGYAEVRP